MFPLRQRKSHDHTRKPRENFSPSTSLRNEERNRKVEKNESGQTDIAHNGFGIYKRDEKFFDDDDFPDVEFSAFPLVPSRSGKVSQSVNQ